MTYLCHASCAYARSNVSKSIVEHMPHILYFYTHASTTCSTSTALYLLNTLLVLYYVPGTEHRNAYSYHVQGLHVVLHYYYSSWYSQVRSMHMIVCKFWSLAFENIVLHNASLHTYTEYALCIVPGTRIS
jgi:hypothetical protein